MRSGETSSSFYKEKQEQTITELLSVTFVWYKVKVKNTAV